MIMIVVMLKNDFQLMMSQVLEVSLTKSACNGKVVQGCAQDNRESLNTTYYQTAATGSSTSLC